jgi:hypothetical protein
MKTVYVLMVEWSRGSGDFKDFSQHDSYSSAEWAARQQQASGANCVIVPRTVAEGSGSATGTGGKGGSIGGIILMLIFVGIYRSCSGPVKHPPKHAAHPATHHHS